MKELMPIERIENKIYLIRGQKVMLDRDLAELYGVKPIRLREQVKRNKERFPLDFMFQLTNEEADFLVSQNAIPSKKHLGGYLPYTFTEHGVAMLASVLKSRRAVKISIFIIKTFVKLRQILSAHKELIHKLNQLEQRVGGHDVSIHAIFNAIRQLMAPDKKSKQKIGFLRNQRFKWQAASGKKGKGKCKKDSGI